MGNTVHLANRQFYLRDQNKGFRWITDYIQTKILYQFGQIASGFKSTTHGFICTRFSSLKKTELNGTFASGNVNRTLYIIWTK